MREIEGDIWDQRSPETFVVIPTNLKKVMGRGLALQATQKFEKLQSIYRNSKLSFLSLPQFSIILFPVKYHYKEKASTVLIRTYLRQLRTCLMCNPEISVALPELGCGFGELRWENVYPIIKEELKDYDDRVLIVHPSKETVNKYSIAFRPGARTDIRYTP